GALVVVEPPRDARRARVFEIHDGILIAVEQPVFPGLRRTVRHPRELEFRLGIEVLAIETVKKRCRSHAIKATVVEAETDPGHVQCAGLPSHCKRRATRQSQSIWRQVPRKSSAKPYFAVRIGPLLWRRLPCERRSA